MGDGPGHIFQGLPVSHDKVYRECDFTETLALAVLPIFFMANFVKSALYLVD